MSQILQVSPLLDGLTLEAPISIREGSKVYRMVHDASGVQCVVKHLSIPASSIDTSALILTGAVSGDEEAHAYYEKEVNALRKELTAFRSLTAESPNICSYARFQVVAKEDRPGFDVYLLAPLRTSLKVHMEKTPMTQKMALQLGTDLCHGLAVLRKNGLMHQNLKPENIFLQGEHFAIGDFGMVETEGLQHAAIPSRFVSPFTAPEACQPAGTLNETSDLYSVGMLLYHVFNGGHAAFEDAESTGKSAAARRISGEELPAPIYADYEMDAIIRKACAPKAEDRYQTPDELREALEAYLERNTVTDDFIVPPLVVDENPLLQEEEEEPEAVSFVSKEHLSEDFRESFKPAEEQEEKPRKKRIWIPIVLAVLLVLAAAACYLYFEYFAISVNSIAVIDKGTDYLTVRIDATEMDTLMVSCVDETETGAAYHCEETVTFDNLKPGTMYTVSIDTTSFRYLKGTLGGTAVTASLTEVLTFETAEQEDGSQIATFSVSGPEPAVWTLTCTAEGQDPITFAVENHACVLDGVVPNQEYTLTLDAGSGYYMTGRTTIPFSYTKPVIGSNLAVEEITPTSIAVVWEADSDLPTVWNAVCSGDNGYASTISAEECRVVFEGTSVNAEYTVAISNDTMDMPLLLTVDVSACTVTEISATTDGTSATVKWTLDGLVIPETWTLTYGPKTMSETKDVTVNGTSITLENLIPDAEYVFTISDPEGNRIGGTMETSAKTGSATEYEETFGGMFPGLFDKPDGDNWSAKNLTSAKTSFAPGQAMVFGFEPIRKPAKQDEPVDVDIMLLIRNENGDPVAVSLQTRSWNDMWNDKLFLAAINSIPEEAGSYSIELYFDGQLVSTQKFRISE